MDLSAVAAEMEQHARGGRFEQLNLSWAAFCKEYERLKTFLAEKPVFG
jgi:hypothetical protein